MAKWQNLVPAWALLAAACAGPTPAAPPAAPATASIRIDLGAPAVAYRLAMIIGVQREGADPLSLDVEPSDSIENVKAKIQDQTGLDPALMTLRFGGNVLDDGTTLADHNVRKNAQLQLSLAPSGVHRWVPADVWEYRVLLRREVSPGQWVDFDPPLKVVVPWKNQGNGPPQALFQKLAAGQRYQASLEAWGNVGGTAATTQLNTNTPTLATFDFTASNDVVSNQSATLTPSLDGVPFSGQGSLSFGSPAPGAFVSPSEAPAVSVGPAP